MLSWNYFEKAHARPKSHMAPVEQVSQPFPAFVDTNGEFKGSTSVRERIKNIVGRRITGK